MNILKYNINDINGNINIDKKQFTRIVKLYKNLNLNPNKLKLLELNIIPMLQVMKII